MKRPANQAAPSRPPAVGVIRDGEVYRLQELQRRLGWGEHALRQAKVAGLRLFPLGVNDTAWVRMPWHFSTGWESNKPATRADNSTEAAK